MSVVDTRAPRLVREHRPRRPGDVVRAYVALTKPRIIELLLVTTVPAMMLAARGVPDLWKMLAVLVGGTMSAGSANAFNCYLDRDIDQMMHRTERRPLVTGAVSPRGALAFAFLLGVVSTALLWATTNVLAAMLSLGAILMYVVGYTMILKRRTAQNIVWGGAAGCMPVLIGWAAVTDSVGLAPFVLFGIVFFWTPPHYWPLSMRYRDDYETAGVPMLPVIADIQVVGRQIVVYSWAMVAVSIALWPVGHTGPLYGGAAIVLGAVWLLEAHRLYHRAKQPEGPVKPMRLFHWSITYLTLLFVALAVDTVLF